MHAPSTSASSSVAPGSSLDRAAVIAALVYPSLLTLVYFVLAAELPTVVQQTIYLVGKLLQFVFPAVWVLLVLRLSAGSGAPAYRGVASGLAFGAVVAAAMLTAYQLWFAPAGYLAPMAPILQEKLGGFGVASIATYAALSVFYSLVHSALEEYYWRWFVYARLRSFLSTWPAIIISSLGFAAHHVIVLAVYFGPSHPLTILFSLSVAVGGLFWAWLYERSGSLWGPWLSHLLVDAAIFIIGYSLVAQWLADG